MAKKTKNQKRKAKVKAKSKQHKQFQTIKDMFRVDRYKLAITFPNKQERIDYLKALDSDFERQLA